MLRPVPLQKVYLTGLTAVQAQALRLWSHLGVVHIQAIPAGKYGLKDGAPLPDYAEVSEQLVRIRAILSQLTPVEGEAPALARPAHEAARAIQLEADLIRLREEEEDAKKQLAGRHERERQLRRLAHLKLDLGRLPPVLSYAAVSVPSKQAQAVRAHLLKSLKHVKVMAADDGEDASKTVLFLATPPSQDLSRALEGLERIAWPSDLAGTPQAALLMAQGESEGLNERLRACARQRMALSLKYYPLCKQLEEALAASADLSRVSSSRMRQSASCFFCEGWVHPEQVKRLMRETSDELGAAVAIHLVPEHAHHGRGRPTLLENPRVAGPVQYLVEFLSLPRADELDPTLISLFTIPIMYGLIVGDAGYALLSFILAGLMRAKSKRGSMLNQFAGLWMLGAIPSFIFGVLFDEYFGFGHHALVGQKYYSGVVHRVGDAQGLLLLVLWVGWIHIALGFLLGAVNEWGHNKKHAIAKLLWLLIQIGGTLAMPYLLLGVGSYEMGMGGLALLAASAVALAGWAEGPMALVEIPGLASNIMSYARIAAVGVAGVILAEVINMLLVPDPKLLSTPAGILTFVFIALAYVLAHVFNTAIAMFEGIIHGARLNVVEFFGKFFKGGGSPFRPLSDKVRMGM